MFSLRLYLRSCCRIIAATNADALYWTVAQMVAHHSCGGCNLRAGDLFGTGTISGADPQAAGSLIELTMGGKQPLTLANGETRTFLQPGDRLRIAARASRPGAASIGFGDCSGEILG